MKELKGGDWDDEDALDAVNWEEVTVDSVASHISGIGADRESTPILLLERMTRLIMRQFSWILRHSRGIGRRWDSPRSLRMRRGLIALALEVRSLANGKVSFSPYDGRAKAMLMRDFRSHRGFHASSTAYLSSLRCTGILEYRHVHCWPRG